MRRRCWSSASPGRCCARPGIRGTSARPSPYSSYDHFDFKIPVGTVGDNYDRYRVRHAEFYESVKIIEQALDGLPEGPFITPDRKVALPPRHELATSMEALIHHFKLVTEGFRVPPGEAYYPIEGPRGELGLLRPRRRLGQARPGPHARPQLRQPPGAPLHGQGRLHRRPDRLAGDARPDPRRDRPVSRPRSALRRRLSRSRLGRGGRPHQAAGDRPGPGDHARPRRAPRGDRGGDGEVPGPPFGGDPGTPRRSADPRLVLARGDRPGRCRDAGDPRLPDLGGDLLRHVLERADAEERRVRVHEHLVLAARRRRVLRGDGRSAPRNPAR